MFLIIEYLLLLDIDYYIVDCCIVGYCIDFVRNPLQFAKFI